MPPLMSESRGLKLNRGSFIMQSALFSTEFRSLLPNNLRKAPYSIVLDILQTQEVSVFDEEELNIFHDVCRHEMQVYEPRGCISGFIDARVRESGAGGELMGRALEIPAIVEPDVITFAKCSADCVLLIEHIDVFRMLYPLLSNCDLKMVLATGCGIPRSGIRRALHRITSEFSLPLYVLADCDAWGYFLASLVARGTMAPDEGCAALAVSDTNYLGLRSRRLGISEVQVGKCDALRFSRHISRVEHLRKYPCFAGREWESEFDGFAESGGGDLQSALKSIGAERFFRDCVVRAITSGEYLKVRS